MMLINDISPDNNITFILGPTNTGKTFMAIERMVSYDNGIIGLPLRLLAREVYEKCIEKVLAKGHRTPDLMMGDNGQLCSTTEMTDKILEELEAS